MEEIWKSVKGFENEYEVSNLGRVRSLDRTIVQSDGKTIHRIGIIRTLTTDNAGYKCICIRRDGKNIKKRVHRLVAEAFIPNLENKPHIDHINTIRDDNRVDNLRWVTQSENSNNKITKARITQSVRNPKVQQKALQTKIDRGVRTAPKPVFQFTLNGELIRKFDSLVQAQREVGLLSANIAMACRKGNWCCGGFLWSFTDTHSPYKPYEHKAVLMYDTKGTLIRKFNSAIEAAQVMGCSLSFMYGCCSGYKSHFGKGYLWRYADNPMVHDKD